MPLFSSGKRNPIGGKKLREQLVLRFNGEVRVSEERAILAALVRDVLARHVKNRGNLAAVTPISLGKTPHDFGHVDLYGKSRLGAGH